MPKAFAWILAAVTVLVLALFGLAIAIALTRQEPPSGSLDTDLEGVTVSAETTTEPEPEPPPEPVGDRECWRTFGADPRRSLARPDATLGLPARKFTWARGLGSYIEFPPVYCEGELYVNGFSGHDVRDRRRHREDPVDPTRRRNAPLQSCDRRAAHPRRVAGRHGHCAQPAVRAKALAGAHRRQGRVLAGRRRRARVLRLARRPAVRGSVGYRARPLGIPDRRTDQREPCRLRREGVRDDVCWLLRLPRPRHGRGAMDDVPQARRVPLRELLCQPVERRRADLQRRALGQGRRARRLERAHRLDGRRRRARLHDACGRRRTRVRGRLRRPPARVPRDVGRRALEHLGRRPHPRRARRHRPVRLLLDAREAHVRAARLRRRDRLAPPARASTRRASRPNGPTSSR